MIPEAGALDELERLRQRLTRREDRARVRSEVRADRRARRARQRQEAIRRGAVLAGESARTRHEVAQSGEARAMRVERTRGLALAALLPVLCAFGGWSAAGVQAGMVALLGLEPTSAAAHAAWLVEPALLGIVAGVILIRARLQSAGGDLDERATRIEWAALSTSILLNAAGHWPAEMSGAALAAMAGHALGPVGAAGTAYLISIIQDGVAAATPWVLADGSDAPSLVDQGRCVQTGSGSASESASESGLRSASGGAVGAVEVLPPALEWVRVPEGARRLPIVSAHAPQVVAAAPEQPRRSVPDQHRRQGSAAPRVDKGVALPKALKSAPKSTAEVSPRALSDEDLAERLAALVSAGEVAADASVRQVQGALGVGFERAKRVLALHYERTETVVAESADEDAQEREEVAA